MIPDNTCGLPRAVNFTRDITYLLAVSSHSVSSSLCWPLLPLITIIHVVPNCSLLSNFLSVLFKGIISLGLKIRLSGARYLRNLTRARGKAQHYSGGG